MERDTPWFVVSCVLALLAGALGGVRVNLARLLVAELDTSARMVGVAFAAIDAVALLVHPLGTFLAGYLWGRRADVVTSYRRYALALVAVALSGFAVTYAATMVPLLGRTGGIWNVSEMLVSDGLSALGLVGVPLAALAGAAVVQFRRAEERSGEHAPSR